MTQVVADKQTPAIRAIRNGDDAIARNAVFADGFEVRKPTRVLDDDVAVQQEDAVPLSVRDPQVVPSGKIAVGF
jgi:hypothetical protein